MRVIDKIKEMSSEELFDFLWKYVLCESSLCEKCKLVNTFVDNCDEWCHYIRIEETYKRWFEMDYTEMVEKTKKYWGEIVMKMTQLGLFLRQLRMENDELLLDMARKLHTTPSRVSSVEMGKATMPITWRDIIIREYGLDNEQIKVFDTLIKDKNGNKPAYVLMQERYDIDTLETLYTKPVLISTDKQKILNRIEQHKNDKGIRFYIENTFMI